MTAQTDLRSGATSVQRQRRGAQPVRLLRVSVPGPGQGEDPLLGSVAVNAAAAAQEVRGDAVRALELARQLETTVPLIGDGQTAILFETLASLAAIDLTAARVAEAHLDGLAIVRQAGMKPSELFPATSATPDATPVWGVFAAEASGVRLNAVQQSESRSAATTSTWRLDGTKPWCSLAGSVSHALVTAHTSASTRRLFAVDLRQPGVSVRTGSWVALSLSSVPSGPVDFAAVMARPIGSDGWYLTRPGFAWGGIAVAACWFGAAVGVARQLHAAVRAPAGHPPDQIALAHLGAIDVLLTACASALGQAAAAIDSGAATGQSGALLAARVRGLVARSAEEVLTRVGHSLGPAPLAFDARHAQRVADLELYVRQHHAERDDAALGRLLLAGPPHEDAVDQEHGTKHQDAAEQERGAAGGAPW